MNTTVTMAYYQNPLPCMAYFTREQQEDKADLIKSFISLIQRYSSKDYKNGHMVDFGVGTAFKTQRICNALGITHLVGVDSSKPMLEIANGLCRNHNLEFYGVNANLHTDLIPVANNSIDIAVSFAVMMYLRSINHVLFEAYRLLKPGSMFIFSLEVTQTEIPQPVEIKDNEAHTLYVPSLLVAVETMQKCGFTIRDALAYAKPETNCGITYAPMLFILQK